MAKVSFCHCISQKATLDVSFFESSHKLIFSSFGVSVPQAPPAGPADCHRSANVDIGGGRTGLLSNIRSNSSITLADRRGNNCNKSNGEILAILSYHLDLISIRLTELPAMLANWHAIAQWLLLQSKDIELVRVSMSRQLTTASDCIPIFQPTNTNHAPYRSVCVSHQFFPWTN